MNGQIRLVVTCNECKEQKPIPADIENEKIVACVPEQWSPVYFEFNGVTVDLLFCKTCATKLAAKWEIRKPI